MPVEIGKSLYNIFLADKRCLACHTAFIPEKSSSFLTKYICKACLPYIDLKNGSACTLCGHALSSEISSTICLECIKLPPPWDGLNYFGYYDELLRHLILSYKFASKFYLVPLFSKCLAETSLALPKCDVLIPMPRHEKRLVSEGFNHMLEICRPLAKQLKIPMQHRSLIRTRYTPPQSTLSAKEREKNPIKSFQASNVCGMNVLLVDDVITTGSTLHHASLALREQGAKNIYIIVIARVM